MCSTKMATEEEMREEAKVKSEQRSFSSAVCKSAIEVGLHREWPGGFGGACWHFWHWSSTDLTEIRHLVASLSRSDQQTLSKFSLIEYHFVFDRGWRPVCFYKPWYEELVCTDLKSAGSFFPFNIRYSRSFIIFLSDTFCKLIPSVPAARDISHTSKISQYSGNVFMSDMFYSKHTTGWNWSPCSNVVAANH